MMAYTDRFNDVDSLISGLNNIIPNLPEAIQPKIAGFLAVNAVTAYELAIKEIINDFATAKHIVFGDFIRSYHSRLNGNIKLQSLKEELKKFGGSYKDDFENTLCLKEVQVRNTMNQDLRSSYHNLLECRHQFVHSSRITLTIQECINNYSVGKNVIDALYDVMK